MYAIRFTIQLFLLLGYFSSTAFAQKDTFENRLHTLQSKDSLSTWLYERLAHVVEKPQERYNYLMQTQKLVWRAPQTVDDQIAWLDLLNTQGYYQLLAGDILAAIASYENAFSYYLKHKVAVYDIVEYTLKPLSNNYTRLGDYEKALYLQQRSLNLFLKRNDPPESIAALYSNMAISYRAMGNLTEAENCVNKGLKLAKAEPRLTIMLYNTLADILYDRKDFVKAAQIITLNLTKQPKTTENNAYLSMSTYTSAGEIYLKLNQLQRADQYFVTALGILDKYYKGFRSRERANIITQRGKIKLTQGQPSLALAHFKQSLFTLKVTDRQYQPIESKLFGDNKLVDVFMQMSEAYLQLHQKTTAVYYVQLALISANKIRNEFADNLTKERLQADLKLIVEKGIAIHYDLFLDSKNKKWLNGIVALAEQSKSRTLLDQINSNQQLIAANQKDSLFIKKLALERAIIYNEKQALEDKKNAGDKTTAALKYELALLHKQLALKYESFRSKDFQQPLTKVLASLPRKRIIAYFVGNKAMYLMDIQNRTVNNVVKLDDAMNLKKMISSFADQYFQHGPAAMSNAPKDFYFASHQIYSRLLQNVSFKKEEEITIIPDDVLGYISFDGLITNASYQSSIYKWPFLIRNNNITYAFSLQTLGMKRPERSSTQFTGLFITHQQGTNSSLVAVKEEASALKNLVSGNFLFNKEINRQSFNQAFEESKVLHIGTHAYLSGKNQEPTLALENDKLFLFELAAKKYAPALVVLSACRTADGALVIGEGIISLARGFSALGTPATIAGLWNVNDQAAAVITTNFYKQLLAQKNAGSALHEAKIDWLNTTQSTEAFYLPYYWDSLIYMGTDQQILLQKSWNWKLYASLLVALMGLIAFYYYRKKKRVTLN